MITTLTVLAVLTFIMGIVTTVGLSMSRREWVSHLAIPNIFFYVIAFLMCILVINYRSQEVKSTQYEQVLVPTDTLYKKINLK